MELRDILARNIRIARAARRLSQEALGDSAGLTRNFIGEIERAEKAATVDTIEAIAAALDMPADRLLRRED